MSNEDIKNLNYILIARDNFITDKFNASGGKCWLKKGNEYYIKHNNTKNTYTVMCDGGKEYIADGEFINVYFSYAKGDIQRIRLKAIGVEVRFASENVWYAIRKLGKYMKTYHDYDFSKFPEDTIDVWHAN